MNISEIRKRLILESVAALAGVLVIAGGVYFLSDLSEGAAEQYNGMTGEVTALTAQTNAMRMKYTKVQQNAQLYAELQDKLARNELGLERDIIKKRFDDFKDRFHMDSMKLTMAAPIDMTGGKYKRQTAGMIASEVTLTFEALTDEDVFDLMNAIQEELPGGASITQLSLARQTDVDVSNLREISRKGKFGMVKGSMKFTWLGIKPITPPPNPNAPAVPPP